MKRIDDVWGTCPEGEIRRFVGVLRRSRQHQIMANVLVAAAASMLLLTAWAVMWFFR